MGVTTTPATGARGSVHIGQETTYGIAVEPTHLIEFTSESLSAQESELMSEAIRDHRGMSQLVRGNLDVQGDLNFEQNASGLGMILRHALGDYIKVPGADGGAHGRMMFEGETTINTQSGVAFRQALVFTPDHVGGFEEGGGKFAFVYRDANRALALETGTGGIDYDSYVPSSVTFVKAYTAPTATDGALLVLQKVTPAGGGAAENPKVGDYGVALVGSNRQLVTYYATSTVGGDAAISLSSGMTAAANDYIMILPALISASPASFSEVPGKGSWVYDYNPTAYAGVFTHHIERGRRLPVGLTVEVHRDAAVFLYTGCKVNSIALTFDANSIVTGTVSLIGKVEHSIATLLEDVVPGAATIKIDKRTAFPDVGTLTIGEETELPYTAIDEILTGPFKGAYEVTMQFTNPLTEDGAIQRFHPRGQNVDSRSSTKAGTIYSGLTSPLTSFETLVYIDGYWEEVLSANFTLNNNLTTDKFGLGSRFRLATVEGRAEIDGTLSMEFDDGKHYNKFLRGEKFSIEFKCLSEADDSLIGTTNVPSQAYYFLPKCKYNGTTPQIGSTDIINHDMPFRAIVDTEYGDTDLVIILVNGLEQDVQI